MRMPHFWLTILAISALMLSACGGGGGSGADAPASAPAVPTSSTSLSIKISSPATNSVVTTSSVNVTGTASGNVTQVDWNNATLNTGGGASGTANWSANVPLQIGSNLLVVTARDSTGKTASVNATITYVQSGQVSVMGQVDSSLVDRNGSNAVYVYAGAVTPDDAGGAGSNPYAMAPVRQDNGCTWSYQLGSLPSGQYTVAFTDQAASDAPNANDPIVFKGTMTIQVQSGTPVTKNFAAARVLRVGPGRSYATPRAASAAAQNGDVVEIDAGEYRDDVTVWRQDNLTLRGVGGGRAYMHATRIIPYTPGNDQENGMGIWVTQGKNTSVENIEFSGAVVPDQNGAGIRANGDDLNVCNGYFHDNENGILGGGGNVLIEYSEFAHNGLGEYGRTHNMYISSGTQRFTLRYSYSHHATIGHNVKSRANENYILYNRIMDEVTGNSSYDIDIPDSGLAYIVGNLIQQGTAADNSTIVAYGAESAINPMHELYVVNNTIVNDRGSGTFLSVRAGTTARIINNIFSGNGTVLSGPGTLVSNLVSNAPGLVNISAFDYRLTAASPARDAGSNPGSVNGFDLTPIYEYVHVAGQKARPRIGGIDIGAYEYSP
jgi:hypothetical protein